MSGVAARQLTRRLQAGLAYPLAICPQTAYNALMDQEDLPYRSIRLALRLTLTAVALAVNINKGRLSIIERGVRPTDAERVRLHAYLGRKLMPPDDAS